jgi:flagellar hook-basal body complex protein FliE
MAQLSEVKKREGKNEYLAAAPEKTESGKSEVVPFEELLSSSIKEVNSLQLEADEMVRKLATGDVEDISEVVLASSRAEVALRMFMELRNKFLDAYQQLSRISA